jgi:Holliday junction resolvase
VSHYAQGTRFEHKVRDDLDDNGYEVIRAAGSKGSSKVDLIGLKPGQLLLVQCKRTGVLGPAEWDRVHEVAGWVGAVPLLAANGPRGRGVTYIRLLGPKRRSVPLRNQLCEVFHLDQVAAVGQLSATETAAEGVPRGAGGPNSPEGHSDPLPRDAWAATGGV